MFFVVGWLVACGDGYSERIVQVIPTEVVPPPPPPPPPTQAHEIKILEQSLNQSKAKLDCINALLTEQPLTIECEGFVQECSY